VSTPGVRVGSPDTVHSGSAAAVEASATGGAGIEASVARVLPAEVCATALLDSETVDAAGAADSTEPAGAHAVRTAASKATADHKAARSCLFSTSLLPMNPRPPAEDNETCREPSAKLAGAYRPRSAATADLFENRWVTSTCRTMTLGTVRQHRVA
jgi:hypothetical protein